MVELHIARQKDSRILCTYRKIGRYTAHGKGRILAKICFEKSETDYRFTRFVVICPGHVDELLTFLNEQEEDIYIRTKPLYRANREYLVEMVDMLQSICSKLASSKKNPVV